MAVNRTALQILWGQVRRVDRSAPEKDKVKVLKKIPFFEHLRRRELEEVAHAMFEREYQEGEFLFETGQPGAALFIVQSGEVQVEIPFADGPQVIATLGKHSFIGELALLDESPRSASARATTPTKVLALFRTDLDRLMDSHPRITAQIYKSLAAIVGGRLKATNELIEHKTEHQKAA
jgi:CRP-like cAMP-binding protein